MREREKKTLFYFCRHQVGSKTSFFKVQSDFQKDKSTPTPDTLTSSRA